MKNTRFVRFFVDLELSGEFKDPNINETLAENIGLAIEDTACNIGISPEDEIEGNVVSVIVRLENGELITKLPL